MRRLVRRFVDWMEHGPTWQTIWFIPLLLITWLAAMIINITKGK